MLFVAEYPDLTAKYAKLESLKSRLQSETQDGSFSEDLGLPILAADVIKRSALLMRSYFAVDI